MRQRRQEATQPELVVTADVSCLFCGRIRPRAEMRPVFACERPGWGRGVSGVFFACREGCRPDAAALR